MALAHPPESPVSDKPRDPEEEYFRRLDAEQKAALAEQVKAEQAAKAAAERKALHGGHCGKCGGALAPQAFRGVEIDVCGECGSVLLDPGELEQLAGKDESGTVARLAALFGVKRT